MFVENANITISSTVSGTCKNYIRVGATPLYFYSQQFSTNISVLRTLLVYVKNYLLGAEPR